MPKGQAFGKIMKTLPGTSTCAWLKVQSSILVSNLLLMHSGKRQVIAWVIALLPSLLEFCIELHVHGFRLA